MIAGALFLTDCLRHDHRVGDAPPVFVSAGAEDFEDLIEAGSMDAAVLAENPDIPTLDRALAPLLAAKAEEGVPPEGA